MDPTWVNKSVFLLHLFIQRKDIQADGLQIAQNKQKPSSPLIKS